MNFNFQCVRIIIKPGQESQTLDVSYQSWSTSHLRRSLGLPYRSWLDRSGMFQDMEWCHGLWSEIIRAWMSEQRNPLIYSKWLYPALVQLSLYGFLQLPVVSANCVGKFCRALSHQQFPLCKLVVFLTEYSCQLGKQLEIVLFQTGPRFLQTVNWIWLKARHNRLQWWEVFQYSQFLCRNN